jgi:hypothetical protein
MMHVRVLRTYLFLLWTLVGGCFGWQNLVWRFVWLLWMRVGVRFGLGKCTEGWPVFGKVHGGKVHRGGEGAQGYTLCLGKCIGLHPMLGNGGPSGLGGWVYDRKCTGLYPVLGKVHRAAPYVRKWRPFRPWVYDIKCTGLHPVLGKVHRAAPYVRKWRPFRPWGMGI